MKDLVLILKEIDESETDPNMIDSIEKLVKSHFTANPYASGIGTYLEMYPLEDPEAEIDFDDYLEDRPDIIISYGSIMMENFKKLCKSDSVILSGKISFDSYISVELIECIFELKPDFDFSRILKLLYEADFNDELAPDLIYALAKVCKLDYSQILNMYSNFDVPDLKLFEFILSESPDEVLYGQHGYAYWITIDCLKLIEKYCDIRKWITIQAKITNKPFSNEIVQYIYDSFEFVWPEEYVNCLMSHDQQGVLKNDDEHHCGQLRTFIKFYPETKISAAKFMAMQEASGYHDVIIDILKIAKFT